MPQETSIETMDFETALAELEQIVGQLEGGDVALEKSISLYERGAALRKACEKKLGEARLKVDKIVLGDDGEPSLEPAALDQG